MRRLGRAFLRAPWARRVAALTVTLGLLGGNSMLVATTVFAAAPTTPVTSGGLGDLLHLGFDPGETEDVIDTLPQQVCQIVPALCRQGTTVFEIPAGVGTLGSAPQHLPGDPRGHVTIPSTGCLLGLIGCGQPTPKPKASAAPTVRPSVQAATATTPAPVSTPAAPTPSAAASGCLLGILGNCPTAVTNTCTQGASGCQATASPTPAPNSNALCVLTCGLLQLGGSSCVATVLTTCVLGPTAPSGAGSAGSSPGACVGTVLCLLGSSCTASVGSTCLLGALLPGLPIIGSGSPQPTAPGQSSGSGTGTVPGSGTNDPSTGSPVGTSFGAGGGSPVTSSIIPPQSAGPGSGPSGINLQQPRRDETVGLVSGLSFGHGLILWPLFGLLDLAALAGLVVVVRRRWTATTN